MPLESVDLVEVFFSGDYDRYEIEKFLLTSQICRQIRSNIPVKKKDRQSDSHRKKTVEKIILILHN